MARPAGAYVSRDEAIVQKFVNDNASYDELAKEWGLSPQRVKDILKAAGVKLRPAVRVGPSCRRPTNNISVAIGGRLHADQARRGMSAAEYSMFIGLSIVRLTEALQGVSDWTLDELIRVSVRIETPFPDFVKPPGGL